MKKTFEEFNIPFSKRKKDRNKKYEQFEEIEKTSMEKEFRNQGQSLKSFDDYKMLKHFDDKFKNKIIKIRDYMGNEIPAFKVTKVEFRLYMIGPNSRIYELHFYNENDISYQPIGTEWEIIILGKRHYTKEDPYGEEDWIEQ